MSVIDNIREQANSIGANVADTNGDDLQYKLNMLANQVEKAMQDAFKGGWVARDSGSEFSEVDDWFDSWMEDEA